MFLFCKTAYFGMSVAQKPTSRSYTSPGKTFAEKKTSFTYTVQQPLLAEKVWPPLTQKSHSSHNYRIYTQ